MATVDYIGGNQPITADLLNVLWSEFDRKMGIVMNGKSWLLWEPSIANGVMAGIMGNRFYFTDLTTFGRIIDLGGASPNYDHTVFTDAVTAATESAPSDHAKKIVYLSGFGAADLDNSLAAHKKETTNGDGDPEDYWVWQDGKVMPQRRHRYGVAELVFEDADVTTYDIPKEWDKYQYFRLHNLNGASITVTFEADDGNTDSFTVPALGCKCVQRRPGGRMQAGYDYFWKAWPGDPRNLTTIPRGGNAAAESARVNNVWNQALIFEVIELFSERGQAGLGDTLTANQVRIIRDPHIVYELDDLYPEYFADPAVSTNLLGDLLHHKGALHYLYRDSGGDLQRVVGAWPGYADLSPLATMGLTITDTGAALTIQGTAGDEFNDIVTPGTNVLYGADGSVVTAAEVTSARTIEHSQPATAPGALDLYNECFLPVNIATGTASASYDSYSVDADGNPSLSGTVSVTYASKAIQSYPSDESTVLVPHADTIGDALLFNTFGLVALNGTDQNSSAATLENRRMVLTAFGPMILWDHKWTFSGSALQGNIFSPGSGVVVPGRPYALIDGLGKIVEHRYATWPGYGWPAYPARDRSPGFAGYNGAHPGFCGPRRTRRQSDLDAGKHPNVSQVISGPSGEDFAIVPLPRDNSDIRLLFTPGLTAPGGGEMPIWTADDLLYEFGLADDTAYVAMRAGMQAGDATTGMPRVSLLREHYNTMAAWVNSCVKCRPYCWHDFVHYLPDTSESGIGSVQTADIYDNGFVDAMGAPGTGTRGILSTSLRPINQYTSFEDGSFLHHLFTALGVTIRTEDDLPTTFLDMLDVPATRTLIRGTYDQVIDTVTSIGTDLWRYKYHYELTDIESVDITPTDPGAGSYHLSAWKIGVHNANGVFDATRSDWAYDPSRPDRLDLSGYLWVSITDVKSAAEAMGLLWLFEEPSLPVKLEDYTVGDSWSTLVDQSPYAYFEESSVDPRSTGAMDTTEFGYNALLEEMPTWDVSSPRFAEKASPDWKRDIPPLRVIADVTAGNIRTLQFGISFFTLKLNMDAGARAYDRSLRAGGATLDYRKAVMNQVSASSAYTIAGGIYQVPVPWFAHPDDDFSEVSTDNARAFAAFGVDLLPLASAGAYSSETPYFFVSGSNVYSPATGQAFEPVFWQDTFISLA